MSSHPAVPSAVGAEIYSGNRPKREQLAADVKSALASAEAMLHEAASASEHEAKVLREKAAEVLARAGDALHGAADTAVAKTKAAAHETDVWVHENPWKAVGVAAGVGLLVGLLVNRR
ncbi:MAG: DUF883 family protein [Burkholderiaceae bacterium]